MHLNARMLKSASGLTARLGEGYSVETLTTLIWQENAIVAKKAIASTRPGCKIM